MTGTRDADPIIRAWLDLMPDEAPDRVIDAILETVELTPQPAPGRLRRRHLPSLARYLGVAAAAIVVALGAMAFLRWLPETAIGPSPVPSATVGPSIAASQSATPSARVIPVVPGDRWILYLNLAPNPGLSLVRPDGSDDHRIAQGVPGLISDPTWSWDGAMIAFVVTDGPSTAIWQARADGSGQQLLLDGRGLCPDGVAGPGWSPDGSRLSFICRTGAGSSSIRVLDLTDRTLSDLVVVRAPEAFDSAPRWSPDGATLAFDILLAGDADIPAGELLATVPAGGGAVSRITSFDSFAAYPDWAPDGGRLAYNTYSLRSFQLPPNSAVRTVHPDGSDPRPLTSAESRLRLGEARWSSEGTELFGVALVHGSPSVVARIDASTGAVSPTDITGRAPAPRPVP
jgi:dipeptidyl aminopeptidase/acylaminoacyl peptidase